MARAGLVALAAAWAAAPCVATVAEPLVEALGAAVELARLAKSAPTVEAHIEASTISISFEHDGKTRSAHLYVPPGVAPANGWPLILDFHAWGSDSIAEAVLTDFSSEASKAGFLVAFPVGWSQANAGPIPLPLDPGVGFTFNAGGCCPAACASDKIDDVGFARALVDYVASEFSGTKVDRRRVFATGMSNGGFMSHRLGCQASDVFAAIAPVSGLMMNNSATAGLAWGAEEYPCSPKRAVPVLHFHGTADPLVPIIGNPLLGFLKVQHTIDSWRMLNGALGDGIVSYKKGYVSCRSWGADANNVTYCLADGAGHSWPGSHHACPPRITPATGCTLDIDATKEIMAFFQRHTMPDDVALVV